MVFCVLLECGMLVLIVWCGIYGGREIGGCLMIKIIHGEFYIRIYRVVILLDFIL